MTDSSLGGACPFGFDKASAAQASHSASESSTLNANASEQCSEGCPVGAVKQEQAQSNRGNDSMDRLRQALSSFSEALQGAAQFGGGSSSAANTASNSTAASDSPFQRVSFGDRSLGGDTGGANPEIGALIDTLGQAIQQLLSRLQNNGANSGGGNSGAQGSGGEHSCGENTSGGGAATGGTTGGGAIGGGATGPETPSASPEIDRGLDFTTLSPEERTALGMNDEDRAILHLWGRQVITDGEQDGSIYSTVLGPNGDGAGWENKVEVELVKQMRAEDNAEHGGDTGSALDERFFDLWERMTGDDIASRYADRPVKFSDGALEITNSLEAIENQTGLSTFEQAVLRFVGHDPLLDGALNGSVLAYTIGNNNSLDGEQHSTGNTIDDMARELLQQDLNDDGVRNGSSLASNSIDVFDKIYERKNS